LSRNACDILPTSPLSPAAEAPTKSSPPSMFQGNNAKSRRKERRSGSRSYLKIGDAHCADFQAPIAIVVNRSDQRGDVGVGPASFQIYWHDCSSPMAPSGIIGGDAGCARASLPILDNRSMLWAKSPPPAKLRRRALGIAGRLKHDNAAQWPSCVCPIPDRRSKTIARSLW